MEFDVRAASKDPLECCLVLFDEQGHDYLTIAGIGAVLDQSNIAVADMLIDHRIAFHPQRIDSFRSHASEQEARHWDRLRIFDDVDWGASSNIAQESDLTKRIAVINLHRQSKRTVFILASKQTALLKCGNMLGNRCSRLNSEVSGYLRVGRLVTMSLKEAGKVIKYLFLSLSAWEHRGQYSERQIPDGSIDEEQY